MQDITLNQGTRIQSIGIGCWMGSHGDGPRKEVYETVSLALKAGYRYIDTAAGYFSEDIVGKAIKESGIPRDQLVIQTKLMPTHHHKVREAFDQSLKDLDCEFIDVYLMHWPMAWSSPGVAFDLPFTETWKSMEKLLEDGRCKAIGISNFSVKTVTELLESKPRIVPAVNQVECHPYLPQAPLLALCQENGIHLQAYSPLGQGNSPIFSDSDVVKISKAHGVEPAQTILAWNLARGVSVLPKSSNEKRLAANLKIPQLSTSDLETISNLHNEEGKHKRLCGDMAKETFVMGWTLEQLGWDR